MTKTNLIIKSGVIVVLCLLTGSLSAFSSIRNTGNDAVIVELHRTEGYSHQINLFPGQAHEIPSGTLEVRLRPRSARPRGDENVRVQIVEKTGAIGTLTRFGEIYTLGRDPDDFAETPVTLKAGRVANHGNIIVNVIVSTDVRSFPPRTLYIEDTLVIPPNTKQVHVLDNRSLRGDERVRVTITFPNGEGQVISTLGGTARMREEQF